MTPLRQKLIRDLTNRGFSDHTIRSYVQQVKNLALHFHRSPELISFEEVQDYLFDLITKKKRAWSTVSVAAHGLIFFFKVTLKKGQPEWRLPRPNIPKKLPVVLSQKEVTRLLKSAANLKHQAGS